MCTSEARSRTACSRIRLTTLTTGAFSSTSIDDGVVVSAWLLATVLGALLRSRAARRRSRAFDAVAVVERPLELVLRGDDEADRRLERFDQPLFEVLESRIGARDDARVRLVRRAGPHRSSRAVSAGRRFATSTSSSWRGEIDGAESELRGERHRDVARREDCGAHEDLAEARRRCGLPDERGVALRLGDELLRDEDVAQSAAPTAAVTGSPAARHRRTAPAWPRSNSSSASRTRPTDPQPSTSLSARTEPSWPGDLHRPPGREARGKRGRGRRPSSSSMSRKIRPPERMKPEL